MDTAEEDGTSNDADELDEDEDYDQDVDDEQVYEDDTKGMSSCWDSFIVHIVAVSPSHISHFPTPLFRGNAQG